MTDAQQHHPARGANRAGGRYWIGLAAFFLLAIILLWEEHRLHIVQALPWLILLACPVIHVFMHGGHGAHSARDERRESDHGS